MKNSLVETYRKTTESKYLSTDELITQINIKANMISSSEPAPWQGTYLLWKKFKA